ncbi:MAG: hypothetical protein H6Q36_125 [Chloroflexi bacterium]|nr:hypothetical protein [Chloroflexota bacterium]
MRPSARAVALAAAWFACALVLSLGVAGIAVALNHPPSTGARPELTWAADRAIAPGLDAVEADLGSLLDEVDALAELGRTALAALVARDVESLGRTLAEGADRIGRIEAHREEIRAALRALPGAGPGMESRLGPVSISRYDTLVAALPAVDGLAESWDRLAQGSGPASRLATHLLEHDRIAGEAVKLGAAGRYAEAVKQLAGATAELDDARTIRDELAARVDVSTLDEWIDRNAAYDEAVGDLWTALRRSQGRVTDAVRDASARERAAKENLPPDTKALVVILGDVARGGLNQAVIAIEEARGRLATALSAAAGVGPPSLPPVASPSPEPATTVSPRPAGSPSSPPAATPEPGPVTTPSPTPG